MLQCRGHRAAPAGKSGAKEGAGERGKAHGEGPTLPFATGGWTGAQLLPSDEGRKGGTGADGAAWLPGCMRASAAANWAFKSFASATDMDMMLLLLLLPAAAAVAAQSGDDGVGLACVARIHTPPPPQSQAAVACQRFDPTRCRDDSHRSAFPINFSPAHGRTGLAVCRAPAEDTHHLLR